MDASCLQDFFPDWGKPKRTAVVASTDGGLTWVQRSIVDGQYWSSIFVHRGEAPARRAIRSWRGGPPLDGCNGRRAQPSSDSLARQLAASTPETFLPGLPDGTPNMVPAPALSSHLCTAGALYLLGTDDMYSFRNAVSIARSLDGGLTWNRSSLMAPPPGCQFATGARGCWAGRRAGSRAAGEAADTGGSGSFVRLFSILLFNVIFFLANPLPKSLPSKALRLTTAQAGSRPLILSHHPCAGAVPVLLEGGRLWRGMELW
jgi:hypothetical protein